MALPRILFIDAYDSFSNNVIALLEQELQVTVTKIHIDAYETDFSRLSNIYSGIVIGPGPGTATCPSDVGIIERVWRLSDAHLLPVLGICLGFQSLVWSFGGRIATLPHPRHGQKTTITSRGDSIFKGLEAFEAIQYHSLHANLDHEGSPTCSENRGLWDSSSSSKHLIPLAWDLNPYGPPGDSSTNQAWNCACDSHPQEVLMGVRHACKPFFGIQFHPESILSSPEAKSIVHNWWRLAREWSHQYERDQPRFMPNKVVSDVALDAKSRPIKNGLTDRITSNGDHYNPSLNRKHEDDTTKRDSGARLTLKSVSFPLENQDVTSICRKLNIGDNQNEQIIILDSAKRLPQLGTRSIVGIVDERTLVIEYTVESHTVLLRRGRKVQSESLQPYEASVFNYLRHLLQENQLADSSTSSQSSFWGGLMGYVDYEACLETISASPNITAPSRPNICFAFVERSIVLDFESQLLYVQSIRKHDNEWVRKRAKNLRGLGRGTDSTNDAKPFRLPSKKKGSITNVEYETPAKTAYCKKVQACQQELSAGNSYELCLTDQTKVEISRQEAISPWNRYQQLRRQNPAPFAAYIRLGSLTLMSSSPERFLCWSRPERKKGRGGLTSRFQSSCQFRPIKGTVKKFVQLDSGGTRHVSLEEATKILTTPKEQAENLMIVDLIRHDLAGVVGSNNISVPYLMSVEEYETVYQLVTVIEGSLYRDLPLTQLDSNIINARKDRRPASTTLNKTGIDVLAASLPPGSMTGAPKKSSCEILKRIENEQPRSVYSGILGYMDVGGRGDFSVVIRTIFKWADEQPESGNELWRIGAGGAVTALSTEEGEWDEMKTKLSSVLGVFG